MHALHCTMLYVRLCCKLVITVICIDDNDVQLFAWALIYMLMQI